MAQIKVLKVSSDGVSQEHSSTADDVTFASGLLGDVLLSGNTVTSNNTDQDLNVLANGTGDLVLEGYAIFPPSDGTSGQHLQTDGGGVLSWQDPPSVSASGQVANSYTAGAGGVLATDCVYIITTDTISKCDTSGAGAASRAIGFAKTTAPITVSVDVVSAGVLSGFTGLTAGSRYFADPGTPGGVTATVPVGTGNTIVQVGYAKNSTDMEIHIEQLGRRS